MKRSKTINLAAMRKNDDDNTSNSRLAPLVRPLAKPLAIAVAAASISGCTSREEVKVVGSVSECTQTTTLNESQCEQAFRDALVEAEKTSPKYSTERTCESEFGSGGCRQTTGGFFMPMMAGFMVGQMLNGSGNYYGHNPVFRYSRPYSSWDNKYMTSDGTVVGRPGKGSYKVPKSATKPKPKVVKTVSRGGFGSSASAKSSWGGGKSSKGWGG